MEITRGSSPPSPIHIHGDDHPSPRRRSDTGRSSGWNHWPSSQTPMAIPGTIRGHEPPPPLPPPRNMQGLATGRDPGWDFKNAQRNGGFRKHRGSTDFPSQLPQSWRDRMEEEIAPDQIDFRRRQSSTSTVRSQTDSERRFDSRIDEGYHSLSGANTGLHGERHLHHRGQERSSQAYDNKLLSKIGKPKTPPVTNAFNSAENSPTSNLTFGRQPLPIQLRSLSFPNSITSNYSDSPVKREPSGRYGESPLSRPISPGTIPSASSVKSFTDYSSSTFDQSRRSSTLASEAPSLPSHHRVPLVSDPSGRPLQKARRSLGAPVGELTNVDESAAVSVTLKNTVSLPTRTVKRESYDHPIFSEPEATFPMEETVEQLHLEDRLPYNAVHRDLIYQRPLPSRPLHSSQSLSGMKRKQMASPPDPSQDAVHAQLLQQTANSASQFSQNASHLSANHFAPHPGSVSSQSSAGFQNGSYASSGGPSVAGSSYTSLDQHSPSAISPSEQSQQYPQQISPDGSYTQSLPLETPPHASRAGPYPDTQHNLDTYSAEAPLPRKTNENPGRRSNAPSLPANSNICHCCPKKPKKFDTSEELRQHESEKQYRCAFCNNRFKNKNEAERHQNSLHLRRHSWSCSALAANYTSAFFPNTDNLPANNVGQPQTSQATHDICGYCGDPFPNDPPNWDIRTKHLDEAHKYRECNRSKKFFRADHFRQHLKHSHHGQSGKWTNHLESSCMRDEPPPIPLDGHSNANTPTQSAPVANMGGMTQSDMSQSPLQGQNATSVNLSQQSVPSESMHQNNPLMTQQSLPAQTDMTNIDPSISAPHLSGASLVANMNSMGPSQ